MPTGLEHVRKFLDSFLIELVMFVLNQTDLTIFTADQIPYSHIHLEL